MNLKVSAPIEIKKYRIRYNVRDNTYKLFIWHIAKKQMDGKDLTREIANLDHSDITALINLLDHHAPVFWNPETQEFYIEATDVGTLVPRK